MDQYDDKTGLPFDFLSFLLHLTFPGHYIFGRLSAAVLLLKEGWHKMVEPLHEKGWDTRLMGSFSDGFHLPAKKTQLTNGKMLPIDEIKSDSDHDVWFWRPDLPIGFIPTSAPLIADASGCPPGYFRVKPNTTASAWEIISRNIHGNILLTTVVDGEILVRFRCLQQDFPIYKNTDDGGIMIHGPAIRCIKPGGRSVIEDYVPVLICKEWPELGHRWERRQRRSGWPSVNFISELKKLGCDFVQKPSHNNKNPEVEWRISFSLIEQKLCQSFTTVQKQCFLIAKVIMKNSLKSCEGYSTYLLKNTMFWMMEDNLSTDWQSEDALARCIILLLETFRGYLNKGILPHYFIEERNLIGHMKNKIRKEMIDETDSVRSNLHKHIFKHCFPLCPLEKTYPVHRLVCILSIDIHVLLKYPTHVQYPTHLQHFLKWEILTQMMLLLAIESRIEVLVNTLKQHGHILEPLVDRPGSTWGDEKAWIFTILGMMFINSDAPKRIFLLQRLSGMLCVYYGHLHKDESLLKSACDHFRGALNNFGPIVDQSGFVPYEYKMSQPELYIFQALVMITMGDYQQALEIITVVRNNEQWLDDGLRLPSEFYGLLNMLIQPDSVENMITLCVYDVTMHITVQLFVRMGRFIEAESLMENWQMKAPSFLPLHADCLLDRQLLAGLGYVWVSNFTNAAKVFQSMIDVYGHMGTDGICAICQSLSGIVKS